MNALNDPDSEIFRETLIKQNEFIPLRLSRITNRYIDDMCPVGGAGATKELIANHLNKGPAQNLIQTFFNYRTTKCAFCKKKKGEDGVRQFERAHCNNYSRYDILLMALDDIYIDDETPIRSGDILKRFIEKHQYCPIYMLCNVCHNTYDNMV